MIINNKIVSAEEHHCECGHCYPCQEIELNAADKNYSQDCDHKHPISMNKHGVCCSNCQAALFPDQEFLDEVEREKDERCIGCNKYPNES